jgi:hypothetical protein
METRKFSGGRERDVADEDELSSGGVSAIAYY